MVLCAANDILQEVVVPFVTDSDIKAVLCVTHGSLRLLL